jgi:POT family proton-dependent oligopeptide transporter
VSQAAADPDKIEIEPKTAQSVQKLGPGGHPWGLYFLFGTEMWERFCYYGMRALLVLYLIEGFGWQPHDSSSVYKWYTSLVYLTPLIGGYLADRFLGIRASIIIGGILMAIGEFAITTGTLGLFYIGLGFLICGNGFFKPNISTLVGKMYKEGDPRRDGAFTIFYMGINLGAGIAGVACGYLHEHYGFRSGFAAAGIGMLIGLTTFLLGRKQIQRDVEAAGNSMEVAAKADVKNKNQDEATSTESARDADESKPAETGIAGLVATIMPIFMLIIAVGVPAKYIYSIATGATTFTNSFMPIAFSIISGAMAFTLYQIKGAGRDKSVVIFSLFFFVVLFWMAFEQAGNALNIWAEFFTHRETFGITYSAEAFQSINSGFIVILAPIFAWIWIRLAKMNREPSTPLKMAIAMIFIVLAFVAMGGAAAAENAGETRVPLAAVPDGIDVSKLDAGRMKYDATSHELVARGVVAAYVVNEALAKSADPRYLKSVDAAIENSASVAKGSTKRVKLDGLPQKFDAPKSKEDKWSWQADSAELELKSTIEASDKLAFVNAGAEPEWRKAMTALETKSSAMSQVSSFWLVLSYFLMTVGELCLSPVGLSMVTKLAPKRYASLFMGVWLLSSSVAQYAGGSIGESWGTITPSAYFNLFVLSSLVGAAILFVLVWPLKKLMHNVT